MSAMSELVARQQEHAARQAALLAAIHASGGRWKSGRAVTALRAAGYHPVSPSTASRDLRALTWAGHLIAHDEKGVRYYTPTGVTS